MFLLALCLLGTALAAPAIPEAPILPEESTLLVSPYIAYPDPILPLRTLEMEIEPELKEENAELPEPKEENADLSEPKEEFPEEPKEALTEAPAPELPKPEPKPTVPLVVKLEVPKTLSFITNWISSLPISFPNFNIPFISDWFRPPSSDVSRVLLHPAYYPGYPGAVIVQPPRA